MEEVEFLRLLTNNYIWISNKGRYNTYLKVVVLLKKKRFYHSFRKGLL